MGAPLSRKLRIAVIGHAEHVTIARAAALPQPGDIAHLDERVVIAGGGGAIAFFQLAKSDAEIHFFTALGDDDAADEVRVRIEATSARIHAARREEPHTRDVVIVTPGGERTILVVGEPLHPRIDDDLPWDLLGTCDAAYFTGQDPRTIEAARRARMLVVTARRKAALDASEVRADVVVGSARDGREASTRSDYAVPPHALVMTEGGLGGRIEAADDVVRFASAQAPQVIAGSYGAGDSFAGALTWYLARGFSTLEACERASVYGAAVLQGVNPLDWQATLN
jgi:ribokinase